MFDDNGNMLTFQPPPSKETLEAAGHMKCVVVEHDWPEYEPTWAAIAARVDGASQPTKDRNDFPRFTNVYCSNCGKAFGPGDHGFSHCESHAHLVGRDFDVFADT